MEITTDYDAKEAGIGELQDDVKKDMEAGKKDVEEMVTFVNNIRHGLVNGDNIEQQAPEWLYHDAELSWCAGICIELPCIDPYAPNISGCCCCPPRYDEEEQDFPKFFDYVLPRLHTGDLLLCSWPVEDGLRSSRFITHSKWTHVGLVYRPSDAPHILKHVDEDYKNEVDPSRPLVVQVLCDDPPRAQGAMYINDFESNVKDYCDKFSCYSAADVPNYSAFQCSVRFLSTERDDDFYKTIEDLIEKNKGKTYAMDQSAGMDLCQSCPCMKFEVAEDDPKTIFCSDWVARAYQGLGLINPSLNPAEFIPSMFDTSRYLWLRKGAKLSKQYTVVGPRTAEERQRFGYKGQPGYSAPAPGKGLWGVDITQKLESRPHEEGNKPGQQRMDGSYTRLPG